MLCSRWRGKQAPGGKCHFWEQVRSQSQHQLLAWCVYCSISHLKIVLKTSACGTIWIQWLNTEQEVSAWVQWFIMQHLHERRLEDVSRHVKSVEVKLSCVVGTLRTLLLSHVSTEETPRGLFSAPVSKWGPAGPGACRATGSVSRSDVVLVCQSNICNISLTLWICWGYRNSTQRGRSSSLPDSVPSGIQKPSSIYVVQTTGLIIPLSASSSHTKPFIQRFYCQIVYYPGGVWADGSDLRRNQFSVHWFDYCKLLSL